VLEVALGALRLLLNDNVERPPQRRLRSVVEAVRAAAVAPEGCAVELRIRGDAEIPSRTGELIADFVAEAMRNVVKHAETRTMALTVTVGERGIRLEAFNGGVAPGSGGVGAGIGLRLLAARARDHRGCVSTRPAGPGQWSTTLTLLRRPDSGGGPAVSTAAAS
jgi:signal transduction histidine kinase